jgi:hypothetical protein
MGQWRQLAHSQADEIERLEVRCLKLYNANEKQHERIAKMEVENAKLSNYMNRGADSVKAYQSRLKHSREGRMTMNKHVELVKKWLADPDSVTQEELEKNRDAAAAADQSLPRRSADAAAYYASAAAAYAAAADANAAYYAADAAYWVKKYEALEAK